MWERGRRKIGRKDGMKEWKRGEEEEIEEGTDERIGMIGI